MESYDYKRIVQVAAERKFIEMYKFFLDILDEIKEDQDEGLTNFKDALDGAETVPEVGRLLVFMDSLSSTKKEQLRKRILDRANDLIREFKS